MNKLFLLHRIAYVLVFALFLAIVDFLFSIEVDFWTSLILIAEGITFSSGWDFIFSKPNEIKDKYK